MKVQITYTEVQYFKIEKEVEMTQKEYKKYLKTGKVSEDLNNSLCSECGDEYWDATQHLDTIVEPVNK